MKYQGRLLDFFPYVRSNHLDISARICPRQCEHELAALRRRKHEHRICHLPRSWTVRLGQ